MTMTKLEEAIKKFPAVVQEQITDGLETAGITEFERLKIIIPALSKAIQLSKPTGSMTGDEEYNITLIDSRDGKVLVREASEDSEGSEKKYTIQDFIDTFNFDSQHTDGRPTMTWDESRTPSGEQMDKIADGTLNVLRPQKDRPGKGSVPASQIEAGRFVKGNPSTEDVASGKIPVDMDK